MDYSPQKRKRGQSRTAPGSSSTDTPPSKLNTSFSRDHKHILGPESQGSPRTKVAYHFQGLQLSSPVNKLDLTGIHSRGSPPSPSEEIRKRLKVLESDSSIPDQEIPETPQAQGFKINFGPERTLDPYIQDIASDITLRNEVDPAIISGQSSLRIENVKQKNVSNASNRLTTSNSKASSSSKQRAGTPPLKFSSKTSSSEASGDTTAATFLEIDQAALTWHDDEITGHLMDDPDDDGRGVNGIGFKPTAAQAYQRLEKRRQQMLDYKTREAREARAKRGARRRGSVSETVESKPGVDTPRQVRFLDGDAEVIRVA